MKKIGSMIGRGLLVVFLIAFISACLMAGGMTFYVMKADNPGPLDLSKSKLNYTTIVYANNPKTGQPAEVDRLYKDGNRIWVDLNKVPVHLQNAVIAIEDERFKKHDGVDWKRTFSAFANFYLHFWSTDQGGSTITQQLVKNITNRNEKKPSRKIQEILSALATEKKYSKDQILQAYLNTITLGNGCYGVQTAAGAYFNTDVSKLDLSQSALIAGLTRSPATYDPFTHPDKAIARRNHVLNKMLELKMISKQQHDQAVAEKLTFTHKAYLAEKNEKRSYFVDQVIVDITNDLMEQKGYSKSYAQSLIFSQGLRIYTTMNPDVQSAMEKVYANDKNFPHYSGKKQPQSAMIIVDFAGRVAGIVGGRGQKSADLILNRTESKRQPGSSIKPVAAYGPAMDLNQVTWSSMISDSVVMQVKDEKTGQMKDWPKNDDHVYLGMIPLVKGLAQSRNTIAVRVMLMIGPQRAFNFMALKLGFKSLVSSRKSNGKVFSDIGPSLAIGAVTDGVTLREMAGGYEIFGNGGKFVKPYTYTKVLDSAGKVVIASKTDLSQAIKPDTAFVMNKLLQQTVTRPDGTANYLKLPNQIVACKTGTTSNNYDRWFVGMTPYYIGAVWFGYDKPKDVGYGTNPSLYAWQDVMQIIHKNLPRKDYPSSGSVVQLPYYVATGKIAPAAGGGTDMGWYRTSNIPRTGYGSGGDTAPPDGGQKTSKPADRQKPTSSSSKTSSTPSSSKTTSAASAASGTSGASGSGKPSSSSTSPAPTNQKPEHQPTRQ